MGSARPNQGSPPRGVVKPGSWQRGVFLFWVVPIFAVLARLALSQSSIEFEELMGSVVFNFQTLLSQDVYIALLSILQVVLVGAILYSYGYRVIV